MNEQKYILTHTGLKDMLKDFGTIRLASVKKKQKNQIELLWNLLIPKIFLNKCEDDEEFSAWFNDEEYTDHKSIPPEALKNISYVSVVLDQEVFDYCVEDGQIQWPASEEKSVDAVDAMEIHLNKILKEVLSGQGTFITKLQNYLVNNNL